MFHDEVHPNLEGYSLIGVEFAKHLAGADSKIRQPAVAELKRAFLFDHQNETDILVRSTIDALHQSTWTFFSSKVLSVASRFIAEAIERREPKDVVTLMFGVLTEAGLGNMEKALMMLRQAIREDELKVRSMIALRGSATSGLLMNSYLERVGLTSFVMRELHLDTRPKGMSFRFARARHVFQQVVRRVVGPLALFLIFCRGCDTIGFVVQNPQVLVIRPVWSDTSMEGARDRSIRHPSGRWLARCSRTDRAPKVVFDSARTLPFGNSAAV